MTVHGKTDIGMVRENNQDSFTYTELRDGAFLAIVCDGMGGHNGGNIASSIACDTIKEKICAEFRGKMDEISIKKLLISAVFQSNRNVYDYSGTSDELYGMGTTAVVALIHNNGAYVANVGDSRLYKLSNNEIEQITKDHSIVQSLIEQGKIKEKERRTHPHRNYITRAIGIEETVDTDFTYVPFNRGDKILLCTDGLTNFCDNDYMCETILNNHPENACNILINYSNRAGGFDNITLIIISFD